MLRPAAPDTQGEFCLCLACFAITQSVLLVAARQAEYARMRGRRCTACLQVMGAYLSSIRGHEHERDMWRQALKMLKCAEDLPEEERLFASLRISYNALKDFQKRMFLDVAFFFLGRRADTAVHAWEGYD